MRKLIYDWFEIEAEKTKQTLESTKNYIGVPAIEKNSKEYCEFMAKYEHRERVESDVRRLGKKFKFKKLMPSIVIIILSTIMLVSSIWWIPFIKNI